MRRRASRRLDWVTESAAMEEELIPMLNISADRSRIGDIMDILELKSKQRKLRYVHILLLFIVMMVTFAFILTLVILINTVRMRSEIDDTRKVADDFRKPVVNDGNLKRLSSSEIEPLLNISGLLPSALFGNIGEDHVTIDPLCKQKCNNKWLRKKPTLVISLDGFSHQYTLRNVMKTLDRFKECGVAAEYMYGSYPTKTFPNHYTIVTGLYPESHGIIDNDVHDPSLSDKLVDTRRTSDSRYFGGEPIWITAAKHKLRTGCLFWAGCAMNISGYLPAYSPRYDHNMTFEARFAKVFDWLLQPEKERTDLLLIYFIQPDEAGHFDKTNEEIDAMLKQLDLAFTSFFEKLEGLSLFGCINIILLSDHGMQSLNRRYYIDEDLNTKGMVVSSGVISRIELANSSMTKEDLLSHFQCKENGGLFRVYDSAHIPKRYHYDSSNRIGDLILEGQPGTTFYATRASDCGVIRDHGYDYIQPTMRTIFFAAGPAFKQKKLLKPFQNIELYNLFADLLGIQERADNNGTYGRLHEILRFPPAVSKEDTVVIKECANPHLEILKKLEACDSFCASTVDNLNAKISNCVARKSPIDISARNGLEIPYCYENFCRAVVLTTAAPKRVQPLAVYQTITEMDLAIESRATSECKFVRKLDNSKCSTHSILRSSLMAQGLDLEGLFAIPYSGFNNIIGLQVPLYKSFRDGPFADLHDLIISYVKHYKYLVVITGAIYDRNDEFLMDKEAESINPSTLPIPAHVFAILININKTNEKLGTTDVLSFILPNVREDLNCLEPLEYLRVNTARVRDIELLTGLEFFADRSLYSADVALELRTHAPEKLWDL